MDYQKRYYPESKYGGFTDVDGSIVFYTRINALLEPSSIVLDVGCGRGQLMDDPVSIRKNLLILKGKCKKVIGIDMDNNAKSNPYLDEFIQIENNIWPVSSESVNICICDNVLEHIENPEAFFSECKRVIKKGGYLFIRTPNVISYFGIFSRLIPNKHHAAVIDKIPQQKKEEDIFPKFYRCNTIRKIKHMLNQYGFDSYVYGYEAEPSYLSFSRFFYHLGVLYQKFAPNMVKTTIFAIGEKT